MTADQSFPAELAHLLNHDSLPDLQHKYPFTAVMGRDRFGAGQFGIEEVTAMTGPTDPESAFAGAVITITRVNALDIKQGMQLAAMSAWHDNGTPRPANAACAREVKGVHVKEKFGRRSRSLTWGLVSAVITVTYTDGMERIFLHEQDRPEYAWIVSV
ncbi:hypothetical protein ACQPYK_49705 (plasmid) [Streptosporangium sp. CA-135522]|uniref:hypothetical protein n=1 Tax=Streptosporangium sp. CA-135522 TaxID=3240072 RepID=UPI003D90DADA